MSFVATGYRQDVKAAPVPVDPLLATRLAEDLASSAGLPVAPSLSLRASSLAAEEEATKPVITVDESEQPKPSPVTSPEPPQAPVEELATIAPIAEDYYRPALAVDPAGNRYAPGNCTWYAYERRLQLNRPIGSFWGNAGHWGSSALAAGLKVSGSPDVGSVLVDVSGYYGHVAVVEEVYSDGSLRISEMNSAWGGGFGIVSGRVISRIEAPLYLYVQ